MLGKFIKHYGKGKLSDLSTALTDAIVSFDPDGATDAAIDEMQENFDKVNLEYSKARRTHDKEQSEVDAINLLYSKRMAAAELIQGRVTANPDDTAQASALEQLLVTLEAMQPDIERETEEAVDAKAVMLELDEVVKLYAEKLKTARAAFAKAKTAMERAERDKERAEDRADRASIAAGITKASGGLSSALDRMNALAENAQAEADAARRKADLLSPTRAEENDVVKAALAELSGAPTSTAKLTAADRLAALRKAA